jgi:hypothetical protein
MIPNAPFQVDDRRNPAASPELAPEAIGLGTAMQELGQASQLLSRQPPRSARWWPVAQGLWSPLVGTFHPLADGPFADAQRQGDLALGPALVLEVPGL